ncbi:MAG: hypothetical protein ABSE77_06325 [Acidimicrobiales bacterium]
MTAKTGGGLEAVVARLLPAGAVFQDEARGYGLRQPPEPAVVPGAGSASTSPRVATAMVLMLSLGSTPTTETPRSLPNQQRSPGYQSFRSVCRPYET